MRGRRERVDLLIVATSDRRVLALYFHYSTLWWRKSRSTLFPRLSVKSGWNGAAAWRFQPHVTKSLILRFIYCWAKFFGIPFATNVRIKVSIVVEEWFREYTNKLGYVALFTVTYKCIRTLGEIFYANVTCIMLSCENFWNFLVTTTRFDFHDYADKVWNQYFRKPLVS